LSAYWESNIVRDIWIEQGTTQPNVFHFGVVNHGNKKNRTICDKCYEDI
jgi:hypothetical protein